jgi:protoporphyrinogen oxidase
VKRAIIMGAGPAGLTAALEMLNNTDIVPIVLEKSTYMGGISRTLNHKGNRIDIGGHRFFSKSDRVMKWWTDILPIERDGAGSKEISYQGKQRSTDNLPCGPCPEECDNVMLVRNRKSRIYFLGQFFDYPITLSKDTIQKLGLFRTARIGASYAKSSLAPIRNVDNLEQFFINRFGRELYLTFFKEYTEKVWGLRCSEISAEWGKQRIKGLSITKALKHCVKTAVKSARRSKGDGDVAQKDTETSLIERFLYPKLGPGQMWDEVARRVREKGGTILTETEVTALQVDGSRVTGVTAREQDGKEYALNGDFVVSTLPIKELVRALETDVPSQVREISDNLPYRDFITVGLLVNKLKVRDRSTPTDETIADNWIYIQEPGVKAGRLQIFNNWSPYLVSDPDKIWLGVEYFCYESDEMWQLSDQDMATLAKEELHKIGILDQSEVLDTYVFRMPKTYPAYFGAYKDFDQVRNYLDGFENLFLVGRNGMHKYNNQDHSMLTAMLAVENMANNITDKSNIWMVNTEQEYHEAKEQKQPAATKEPAIAAA